MIALIGLPLPIVAFVITLFVPESPVFLVKKEKLKEAATSLTRLYGSKYKVDTEVSIMHANFEKMKANTNASNGGKSVGYTAGGLWNRFVNRPEVYKPFWIIVTLSFIQQFSGMTVLR